jgi:hypothetical protein
MYAPSEFAARGYYVYTMHDLFAATSYTTVGWPEFRHYARPGCNGDDPLMYAWYVASNFPLTDVRHQSIFNSQTSIVRIFTPALRIGGLDKDSLHIVRRDVLRILPNYADKWIGDVVSTTTTRDRRINGSVTYSNGTTIWVAVGGHLTNLLVLSAYYTIDWIRYTATLEDNIARYRGDNRARRRHELMWRENVLSESSWKRGHDLWHGITEMYLAIGAALVMIKALDLKVDVRAFRFIYQWLREQSHGRIRFQPGFQAGQYSEKVKE